MNINDLIAQAWEQASQNEFFQGGFLLGILAWIGMQLKSIPMQIWGRIERRIKYVAYIDNTNTMYRAFAEWYHEKFPGSFKRIEAKLKEQEKDGKLNFILKIRQYTDLNFVRYNRWFVKVSKDKTTIDNASSLKNRFIESYSISSFLGRRTINKMLEEVRDYWDSKHGKNKGLRAVVTDRWYEGKTIYIDNFKTLDQIFVEGKDELVKDINQFMERQPLYKKQGIRFKRGYLLYGPPGTGKTTLVFGVAHWLGMPIYYLNPAEFNEDSAFESFVSDIEPWSIILIEDVDIFWTNREDHGRTSISFQSLLNVLDGLHSPNNVLIFMTTNKEGKFDEAFLRKGRLDYKMFVDHPSQQMIGNFVSNFYNTENVVPVKAQIPMVDVQDICIKSKDYKTAIDELSRSSQRTG